MRNNFENSQSILQSADSRESADYARHNHTQVTPEQLKFREKQREQQRKNHEKIEKQDKKNADIELEKDIQKIDSQIITEENLEEFIELNYSGSKRALNLALRYLDKQKAFGLETTEKELKHNLSIDINEKRELSKEDEIKLFKEQLSQQGESLPEILQTLLSTFGHEEMISQWAENWRNLIRLFNYAENKPPQECKTIQNIIAKADFTNENSFENSLTEIYNSTELSAETKLEISKNFSDQNISSVNGMDTALNQIKSRKNEIEQAIESKSWDKDSLETEIIGLEKELEALSPDDPKRKELEIKLTKKKQAFQQTATEIEKLKKEETKENSFTLRDGFSAKLNPNGSRSINIEDSNFTIQLPDNTLFMGRKNMLAINLAFTYKALNNVGMESLFTPKLNSGEVPDKNQRIFSNKVLQQLGYKTDTILSQNSVNQLEKDMSMLKQKGSNSTGIEDLTALGIWDNSTQEVNIGRLKKCLNFIRQNRDQHIEFEDVKAIEIF